MKAAFGAEAIGLGQEAELDAIWLSAAAATGMRKLRPWCAEITGTDPRYGFARRFLAHKTDYRETNSKATRGVWFWWTLESGHVYEVSYRTSWNGGFHRRFLQVTPDGDIDDTTEEEVRAWLSADSASTS